MRSAQIYPYRINACNLLLKLNRREKMPVPYFPFGLKQRHRLDHAIKLSAETKHFLYHFSRNDLSFTLFSSSFGSVIPNKQPWAFMTLFLQRVPTHTVIWAVTIMSISINREKPDASSTFCAPACSMCKYMHIPFLMLFFLHSKLFWFVLFSHNRFLKNVQSHRKTELQILSLNRHILICLLTITIQNNSIN